jgi:hypothetical protein
MTAVVPLSSVGGGAEVADMDKVIVHLLAWARIMQQTEEGSTTTRGGGSK